MPRLVQTLGRLRPPLACPRLPAPRPVAHPVVRHRRQHRLYQPGALLRPCRLQLRRERRQSLLGALEADLARLHFARAGGHGHDRAQQVVRQQVNPDLLLDHLRRLAAQDVHLHRRFDGSDIDLPVPPPLIHTTDLAAVYRGIEDRRWRLELLDAVVLVAGIDAHLPHQQGLGVGAVLFALHAARLVGPLPEDEVAVGPALYRLAAHALRLDTHHQLDPTLTQL